MKNLLKNNWLKLVILLVFFGFVATAYGIFQAREQDQMLFANNLKCQGYEQRINDDHPYTPLQDWKLYRLFYSPQKHSCLAAEETLNNAPTYKGASAWITDVLTGETIWSQSDPNSFIGASLEEAMRKQISSLR